LLEPLHILGYLGALLTGVILGLLGGGGALLSIPVLVYLFHIEPQLATSYSLILIGITATSGAYQNIRKKQVDYNAALYYGIPSVIAVYTVRRWVMPNLPKVIFSLDGYAVDKNLFILVILAIVMFAAAYKMITAKPNDTQDEDHKVDHLELAFFAILIGSFLGLVGAGGGFLMVPALIYFANVHTKKAIGTSLLLVAVNSFIGFLGDMRSNVSIDWKFFAIFACFSVAGVFIGHYLTNYIHNDKLKKSFGWFILVTAIFIVVKEFTARYPLH
jgi:uncharacterized membrane protein YfcA